MKTKIKTPTAEVYERVYKRARWQGRLQGLILLIFITPALWLVAMNEIARLEAEHSKQATEIANLQAALRGLVNGPIILQEKDALYSVDSEMERRGGVVAGTSDSLLYNAQIDIADRYLLYYWREHDDAGLSIGVNSLSPPGRCKTDYSYEWNEGLQGLATYTYNEAVYPAPCVAVFESHYFGDFKGRWQLMVKAISP